MSYEIVYDKQFIRVNDKGTNKYIPMVLAGSSNCYEWSPSGAERRTRSFFPFTLNGKLMIDEDDVTNYWGNVLDETVSRNLSNGTNKKSIINEVKKSFGYYTSIYVNGNRNTSYGNIVGIFKTGIKKALTIEQLKDNYVNVVVSSGYIGNNQTLKPFHKVVNNDVELLEAIEDCKEYLSGTNVSTTIKFSGISEDKPKLLRKKFFPKSTKEPIKTDKYYIIKVSNGTYLFKSHRGGFNYVWTSNSAKRYACLKTAKKQIERLSNRFSNLTFDVKEVNLDKEICIG